jgi:predicted CXXCH cytochrome family protein
MRNSGRVAAAFAVASALAAGAAAGCSGGPGDGDRPAAAAEGIRDLQATVDRGDPVLPAGDGFVGSASCLACHGTHFDSWSGTAHARGLREAGRPGPAGTSVGADSDGDGIDDFREGVSLGGTQAFASFGASAPRLSYAKGEDRPYRVTLGGATFEILRVYGGRRREDYLVRLGRSLYPAPMEWDAEARTWVALETGTWYAGTTPRFPSVASATAGIDRSASFERRCAGCHHGGFAVAYDTATSEWVTGYSEIGVGCESCHGPGRDHVAFGGDPARIVNPRALADGTAAGARRADDTCARCHTRGTGATIPDAPAPVLYAWSAALARPFLPGDAASDFLAPSSDPAEHWGYRDNFATGTPTPGDPSDDAFVAARAGWMQGNEHALGAHAAGNPASARCFDCHAAHGSAAPSGIVPRSTVAPEVPTSVEDGSLCLACHAGTAPFASLDAAAVGDFARGGPSAVPAAVLDHMADAAAMPVPAAAFDPRGTGVGRCVSCHMAPVAQERRSAGTDAGGFAVGGPGGGSHGGHALWPSVSARHGVGNACSACHPTGGADAVGAILDEWATGDPDGDGRLHGYSARGEFLGVLNAASGKGLRCAQCHVTGAWREIVVRGDPSGLATDDPRLGRIVAEAVRYEEGITCASCHGRDASGAFAAGPNALRIPKPALCSSCHHSGGITFADYAAGSSAVHFPQKELVDGTAGSEPPGSGFYEDAGHAFLADGCVKCHYDTGTAGVAPRHDFQPDGGTCLVCHPGANGVDAPTFGDYDGDGTLEGIQGEVAGLLAVLRPAILAGDAAVTFDGTGFRRNGVPGLPGASVARQRAAYNWEVVSKDGSRGAHNGPRAVKLLQQSYRELTGTDVPGATIR